MTIVLDKEVRSILQWVSQGYAFSNSVSSELFPMEAQQMLQIGEQSGKLALMLEHIADNYQEKLNHQIDLLSQMLEPLMMVIIGSLIGIIMMGMYLPIFNMGVSDLMIYLASFLFGGISGVVLWCYVFGVYYLFTERYLRCLILNCSPENAPFFQPDASTIQQKSAVIF